MSKEKNYQKEDFNYAGCLATIFVAIIIIGSIVWGLMKIVAVFKIVGS